MIHTVGPIWHGGNKNEDSTLASAYRRSLEVAKENKLSTVSFPSISTGAYGFPLDRAAKIALSTIAAFLQSNPSISRVSMVLFSPADLNVYEKALKQLKE